MYRISIYIHINICMYMNRLSSDDSLPYIRSISFRNGLYAAMDSVDP